MYNDDSVIDVLYFKEMKEYDLLTKDKEIELNKLVKKGDKNARDDFVKANLRLVIKLAREFSSEDKFFERDLRQVGNGALLKAADRYDSGLGRFSTYATECIKKSIIKYLNEKKYTIKLTQNRKTTVNRIIKISGECEILDMHHLKSIEKITEELNSRYRKSNGKKYTIQDVEVAVNDYQLLLVMDLDKPTDDGDTSLIDGIECCSTLDPVVEKGNEMLRNAVMGVIEKMEDKIEKDIIIRLYGLHGRRNEKLEEIGQSYGLTIEKVRQIQARVFRKLKKEFEFLYEEICLL